MSAWLWQNVQEDNVLGFLDPRSDLCEQRLPHPSKQNVLDTSSVSYNSTHSWHCPSGYSVRSSQVRARSHRAAALTTSDASHKPRLLPMLPIYRLRVGGSMTSSLDSINLLENVTELRKTFYLLDHWFIIKGYNSGKARWKKCTRERTRNPHGLYGYTTLPKSPPVHQPLNSPQLHPFEVLWRLHCIGTMDESLALGDWNPLPALPSFPDVGKAGLESSNPLITWLVPLAVSFHP